MRTVATRKPYLRKLQLLVLPTAKIASKHRTEARETIIWQFILLKACHKVLHCLPNFCTTTEWCDRRNCQRREEATSPPFQVEQTVTFHVSEWRHQIQNRGIIAILEPFSFDNNYPFWDLSVVGVPLHFPQCGGYFDKELLGRLFRTWQRFFFRERTKWSVFCLERHLRTSVSNTLKTRLSDQVAKLTQQGQRTERWWWKVVAHIS